jgi:hypothetical protein
MAHKSYYVSTAGKLHKLTATQMKQVLKAVVNGKPLADVLAGDQALSPITDLDALTIDDAKEALLKIVTEE